MTVFFFSRLRRIIFIRERPSIATGVPYTRNNATHVFSQALVDIQLHRGFSDRPNVRRSIASHSALRYAADVTSRTVGGTFQTISIAKSIRFKQK
jgi:hypothetical protein